mgnify:CR=1 FL=1
MWFPRRSGKAIWTKSLFFISDAEGLWEKVCLQRFQQEKQFLRKISGSKASGNGAGCH